MNLTIVKVIKGTAGMVSGLIDQLSLSQVLGCTYGDDTVMVITCDQDDSYFVRDKLNSLLD
jgi:arginine repressor